MTRTKSLLTLLIALALFAAPLAAAEEEDDDRARDGIEEVERRAGDDDRDDGDLDEVKRKVELDVAGARALIKLSRESGETEDEIKILYEKGTFKVEYESENATVETETELKVRFREAIEFRDLNGNGAYDLSDETVRSHRIDDLAWRVEGPEDIVSGGGVPGHRITGIGSFPDGGALVFVLYVYGDYANVNGTTLRPSEAKIDIILDHFPFTADDTLPALIVKSEQEREIEVEGHSDGMSASVGDIAAYFSWAPNATVDGVDTPVHTTMLKTSTKTETEGGESSVEREQRFALSYARGTFVNHDPQIGIQSAGDAKQVPNVGLVGVLMVGVAALALRRKN